MCRLYGFRANEPTKLECSLVRAQNALMAQSVRDRENLTHGHGWGVAEHPDGVPFVEKQAWAAYHGEHFKKTAARLYSRAAIAHVRRATVGPPSLENTHPFVHGLWLFAHNGTVPNFDQVRERLLPALDEVHRSEIHGSTDSEHIFRYLLTLWGRHPERLLAETLRRGLEQTIRWALDIDPAARLSLNVLWTNGEQLVGSRLNRTLWCLERQGLSRCEICGESHVHHDPKQPYRAIEIASEPITAEDWREVPNGSVFAVGPDFRLHVEPMGPLGLAAAGMARPENV
ncbi:MAG: class II glutamine amidotransferase [Kiloniellales bacterium]|nr:class II glutamine amidotransferase [Kiloniellales bacterium]